MLLSKDKEAIKQAKDQYEDINKKINIYLEQLKIDLNSAQKQKNWSQSEVLDTLVLNVNDMQQIIKSRGVGRALKTPSAGDEVLFKDATSVLTTLYEGITQPTSQSADNFLSAANHFNNQHKTKEQDRNLFIARTLTCAAVVGFLCGLALLPTPLAPLGIALCVINGLSAYNAWDSYNEIKKHDEITNSEVKSIKTILNNQENTKKYKELNEKQRSDITKSSSNDSPDASNNISLKQ